MHRKPVVTTNGEKSAEIIVPLCLQLYLSDDLKNWVYKANNNELYKVKGYRTPFIPFNATLFVDVCKAYISAKNDGIFDSDGWEKQSELADKLLAIMFLMKNLYIKASLFLSLLSHLMEPPIYRQEFIQMESLT